MSMRMSQYMFMQNVMELSAAVHDVLKVTQYKYKDRLCSIS